MRGTSTPASAGLTLLGLHFVHWADLYPRKRGADGDPFNWIMNGVPLPPRARG